MSILYTMKKLNFRAWIDASEFETKLAEWIVSELKPDYYEKSDAPQALFSRQTIDKQGSLAVFVYMPSKLLDTPFVFMALYSPSKDSFEPRLVGQELSAGEHIYKHNLTLEEHYVFSTNLKPMEPVWWIYQEGSFLSLEPGFLEREWEALLSEGDVTFDAS